MAIIDEATVDGASQLQSIADMKSLDSYNRASLLGMQELISEPQEGDFNYGRGDGFLSTIAGFGDYMVEKYMDLGGVQWMRNKVSDIPGTNTPQREKELLSIARGESVTQDVDQLEGIATKEWLIDEWDRSQPRSRASLAQLKNAGMIEVGMQKDEVERLVLTTNEVLARKEGMAKYNAGWGTMAHLMTEVLTIPVHPLNILIGPYEAAAVGLSAVFSAGRVGKVARAVAAAKAAETGGTATFVGIAARQEQLARFLATKTVAARLAQVGITASRGAVPFGSYMVVDKMLRDMGTNHISNHPGLYDEAEAFLEGAGMGVATFGAFSAFAQGLGFIDTTAMSIPALKFRAVNNQVKRITYHLRTLADAARVRKVMQGEKGENWKYDGDEFQSQMASQAENADHIDQLIERTKIDIAESNALPGEKDSLTIALYQNVQEARAEAIKKMVAFYKSKGVNVTIVEHPQQKAVDAFDNVVVLLKRAKEDAIALKESGIGSPSLLNVFAGLDRVNSLLASNRFTEFLGGYESRMRNRPGNVLGGDINTLFGGSEVGASNANVMRGSSRTGDAVKETLNAALLQRKIELRRAFVEEAGHNPTNEELEEVIAVIEKAVFDDGTTFGGNARDHFTSESWLSDPRSPAVKAMAKGLIEHMRGVKVMLDELGLLPKLAPESGTLTVAQYAEALLDSGLTPAQLKKFKFREEDSLAPDGTVIPKDTAASMRDRAIRMEYFPKDKGSIWFPRTILKDLVRANGDGYRRAIIKQFKYERNNVDMHDPLNAFEARLSVIVRAWEESVGAGGKAARMEILDLLRKHEYHNTNGPFGVDDLNMSADELADLLHGSQTGKVINREDFGFSGVIEVYEDAQMKIWTEAADDSLKRIVEDKVADPTETARGQGASGAIATPDSLKSLVFRRGIVPELREFTLKNPDTILNRYSATIHGEIGAARALQDPNGGSHVTYYQHEGGKGRAPRNAFEADQAYAQLNRDFNSVEASISRHGSNEDIVAFRKNVIDGQLNPIRAQLKRLVGQQHYVENMLVEDSMPWLARNMKRAVVTAFGGSMALPNTLDGTFSVVENLAPRNIQSFGKSMGTMVPFIDSMSKQHRMETLETFGMLGDLMALTDIRPAMGVGRELRGSTGLTKIITSYIDKGLEASARATVRAGGLDLVNRFTRRASTILAWKDTVGRARKLRIAVDNLMKDPEAIAAAVPDPLVGSSDEVMYAYRQALAAREKVIGKLLRGHMKKAGLSPLEAGRLNKTGISYKNVIQFTDDLYTGGRQWGTNKSMSELGTMDDFLKSNGQVVFDFADATRGTKSMYDGIIEGVQYEVRHYYNVTPSTLSMTPLEDQNQFFKIINHMSSFLSAYSSQRLRPLAQMGAGQSAAQTGGAFLSAWMLMAVQRDLSGQVRFGDSVRMLQENPLAELYSVMGAGGSLGSMHRVLGALDAGGIGPAQMLGVQYGGGSYAASQRDRQDFFGTSKGLDISRMLTQLLGPAARGGFNMSEGLVGSAIGGMSNAEKLKITRSLPLQNFLPARVVNYFFDDPLFWMSDAQRRINQRGPYPR